MSQVFLFACGDRFLTAIRTKIIASKKNLFHGMIQSEKEVSMRHLLSDAVDCGIGEPSKRGIVRFPFGFGCIKDST